jgi:osmotically-inducible protein OsmY
MKQSPCALAAAVALFGACGTDTATKEPEPPAPDTTASHPVERDREDAIAIAIPENETDRTIRRDLNLAIADDPQLKDRAISFLVRNGDVSVTGTVRSEGERRKINDLAMNITGVKSVANALRVEE